MRFVTAAGLLQKARRYVSASGGVQEDEVKNPTKLAELLRQMQRRLSELEAVTPPEGIEFEVNVGAGGAISTMLHGLNGPIRWYVVTWMQTGGTAIPTSGPRLVQDASSTSTQLVVRSYAVGRAIVRVEPAFAGVDPGITVLTNNRAPKHAALAVDVTNAAAGAYADLLTTTVVTEAPASSLIIQFAASFVKQTAAGGANFQIQVNSVIVVDGSYVTVPLNSAGNAVLSVKAAVTAGTQTVLVRWASNPNQLVCRPVTNLNEFAAVYIQEVL